MLCIFQCLFYDRKCIYCKLLFASGNTLADINILFVFEGHNIVFVDKMPVNFVATYVFMFPTKCFTYRNASV